MKITHVQLHPVAVSRQYATQIAEEGGGTKRKVERSLFLFLEAKTDSGLTGWGEASDIEPDNWPKLQEYAEQVSRFLIGRDPFEIQKLHHDFQRETRDDPERPLIQVSALPLDLLCYDLQGKSVNLPVYQLLGGRSRNRIHVSWVAYIRDDLKLLREEIHAKVGEGFTAFKLKVGVNIDQDEERLAVLRETAGPQASLKIDPNGGWSLDEAVENVGRLARFNLAGVETPVAGRGAADLAAVRSRIKVPVLEHVSTPAQALDYLKHDSVDCFNISTPSSGGIWPARVVGQMASAAGVGLLLGSTVELGPGTLGLIHLGAAVESLTLPSDLIGPGMYRDDVLKDRLIYRDGHLDVPHAPGLGFEIDRKKLEALKYD